MNPLKRINWNRVKLMAVVVAVWCVIGMGTFIVWIKLSKVGW